MRTRLGGHNKGTGQSKVIPAQIRKNHEPVLFDRNLNKIDSKEGVMMEGATVLEAFGYYLIRLVMYGAVAAIGIAVVIKLRKVKNEKEEKTETTEN